MTQTIAMRHSSGVQPVLMSMGVARPIELWAVDVGSNPLYNTHSSGYPPQVRSSRTSGLMSLQWM